MSAAKQLFVLVHANARRNAENAVAGAPDGYMVEFDAIDKVAKSTKNRLLSGKIDKPVKLLQSDTGSNQSDYEGVTMAKANLTAARLREIANFNPETGLFTRLKSASNIRKGTLMGCIAKNGYLRARIDGHLYYIHRLAWLYMEGVWPDMDIDHRDGDRSNNQWANLRGASRSENKENIELSTSNASGVRNVYFDKPSGKWQVKIMKNYKSKSYGYFDTIEDASVAALEAKRSEHKFQPEFTR